MAHFPFNSPVAKKLVWWFIAISTTVALFSTGVQLYLDYRHEVNSIRSYLSSLNETYLPSIAKNTWLMDDNQLNTLLEGITNRDDISYAAVSIDNAVFWSSGINIGDDRFNVEMPITYMNKSRVERIGTLTVIANLDHVYKQLMRRTLIVLFSNAVKTFIVAALALMVVQSFITRHLQSMAAHVSSISFSEPVADLVLDRKDTGKKDELDAVANALSSMQKRGYKAYRNVLHGEQQLRLFLDSTEEGIFGIDSSGVILYTNSKCLQLLGFDKETEMVGTHYSDLFLCRCLTQKCGLEKNVRLDTVMMGSPFTCEDSYITLTDKSGFYAAMRAYPTFSDDSCSGAVVFFSDTSDQRELRYQTTLLKEALDTSPISVLITDNELTVVYVNPGFEKGTGYKNEEIRGKKLNYISDDDTFRKAYQAAAEKTLSGSAWEGRIRLNTRYGKKRVVDVVASPVFDDRGQITNLVAVSRDVTYEEELQNHLITYQKQKALGRLSASIAHEFGNPLLGIKALLKDFRERPAFSSEDKELVVIAMSECDRMQNLIRDIQTFYGLEKTEQSLCDVPEIINKVFYFQQKNFLDNDIVPTINHAGNLPKITGKEDQLGQVILNLVLNAVDSMKPDGGSLSISSSFRNDTINVTVTDTGTGIEQSHVDRIFEPFFSTKPDIEGAGLGLSVSYGIVAAHGGEITCQSIPGSGSRFDVHLPVQPAHENS